MCWYLGRQGSSANGSWENTESSPEEQELRVSGKLGEYCSAGAHRSKYSCRQEWEQTMKYVADKRANQWRRKQFSKSGDFPDDGQNVLVSLIFI